MTEYRLFTPPVADVMTVDVCMETFHRYRAEYIKRHGGRPEMSDEFTPHEGGITFTKTEDQTK